MSKKISSRPESNIWSRQVFTLFYSVFFLITFVDKILPGYSIIHNLSRLAFAIQAPAIIFAAGCLAGGEDPAAPDFKKKTLMKALYSYLCFLMIGYVTEVLIKNRDIYATAKDLLTLVRIPDICSIFLTLSVFFLIWAFFHDQLLYCLEREAVLLLIYCGGLLLLLIPEGILGYGPVGLLVGGDRFSCIPVFCYLYVFLFGVRYAQKPDRKLADKKTLAAAAGLVLFGGVMVLLHRKHAAVVSLGTVLALPCLIISSFLYPVLLKGEAATKRIRALLQASAGRILRKKEESRLWDLLFYYGGFCILFAFTAYFVFYPYIREGRLLLWYVDGLGQYVPRTYRFIRYIPSVFRDLLKGNMDYLQYDYSSGLGSTITLSHEPIYWLSLLFAPSKADLAYSNLVLFRYFCGGISLLAMLRYFRKSAYVSYAAAIVYTFSGYAVYTGTKHGQFLAPVILLPLLVMAMEELVSKKKWLPLAFMTAVSLLSSYYFMYMNTIALGIYFVLRILCTKELRTFRTFFTRGLLIVAAYILGCAMGSITLFNSFGGYVGSSRSAGESVSKFLTINPFYYRSQWIPDFFVSFISDSYAPGLWLKVGLAPIAFLCLVFLFTRKRKQELRPLFLILTGFCIFPVFGYVFNGFSNVSNRWCYIYVAALVFIFAEYMEDLHELSAVETCIMAGITLFYGLVIFFSTKYRTDKVFGAFGLLTMTMILLLLINSDRIRIPLKAKRNLLFGMALFSVIINANLFIANQSGDTPHMESYLKAGDAMEKLSDTALKYLDEVPDAGTDRGFFRSTNLKTLGNVRSSGMVLGYNDISTFNSTLNGNIVAYNSLMGNADYNIVSIYSYNFRTILHELACVRYIGADDKMRLPLPYGYRKVLEKDEGKSTRYIYENDYTLPLGYSYSTVTDDVSADRFCAAQKQELSMISAIVDKEALPRLKNLTNVKKPALTVHKLPVKVAGLNNVTMENGQIAIGEGGGSITFQFKGEKNAETYLAFDGEIVFPADGAEHFCSCDILAKDLKYHHKFRVDAYSTGQAEYLFHLGYRPEALSSCTISFREAGQLTYKDISVYSQPMDSYADRVSSLKEAALEHVTVNGNTVTGSITAQDDRLLLIALPYQSGWKAYIDGKETEIFRANYQYMALNLPAGKHAIRLHYQIPGLKMAFVCTAAGCLVFLGLVLFGLIRRRSKKVN